MTNEQDAVIIKEFSYTQESRLVKMYCSIIKRYTPNTETGITWEVTKQIGTHAPVVFETEYYSIAEMDFKNFVIESLNTDVFYTYSAKK